MTAEPPRSVAAGVGEPMALEPKRERGRKRNKSKKERQSRGGVGGAAQPYMNFLDDQPQLTQPQPPSARGLRATSGSFTPTAAAPEFTPAALAPAPAPTAPATAAAPAAPPQEYAKFLTIPKRPEGPIAATVRLATGAQTRICTAILSEAAG